MRDDRPYWARGAMHVFRSWFVIDDLEPAAALILDNAEG